MINVRNRDSVKFYDEFCDKCFRIFIEFCDNCFLDFDQTFISNFVTNILGTGILIKSMANLCPDADPHNYQEILATYCFGENAQCHNFS